jgi:hypothetical protein
MTALSYLARMPPSRSIRLVVPLLALAACAAQTTRQAPNAQPSGFLGDYSRLAAGGPGKALLRYQAPDANIGAYDKVILDPVTVWRAPGASDAVPRADLQRLADLLYGMLRSRLRTYYVMVHEPAPRTLRIRAALTEATPSSTTMDVMSQIGPISGTTGEVKQLATGTPAWVGAASAEIQVLDAETGRELMAAVDRRVGEKTLAGASEPWGDVTDTFGIWADAVIDRLQAEGGPREPVPWWAQPR